MRKSSFALCCIWFLTLAGAVEGAPPWTSLFDGKQLDKWELVKKGEFEKRGKVKVTDNKSIVIERGEPTTGIRFKGKVPRKAYELELEARRTNGTDFFCGLTFPIADKGLTLILGGWGGQVVGLSVIDERYAINNETVTSIKFQQDKWYKIRIKVTSESVEVFVDGKDTIYFDPTDKKLEVSEEMQPCFPLGIATWKTTAEIRNIRIRSLMDPGK